MEDVVESKNSELTKMEEILKETETNKLEIEKKYENILLQNKVIYRVCGACVQGNMHNHT